MSIDPSDPEMNKEIWELHTDGAASKEASDAGLILKNHSDDEVTYALRFDFQFSNKEAEYESLLAGLRLAREVRAKHLLTFSDSLLITNQVNDTYEAKDQRMHRYMDATLKLTNLFKSFRIKQISGGKTQGPMLSTN
uniref:RNase H type-1 domain-containing protein n=1 Tax=Lactuca sativa TaxID=4236 RepID=A0A9R1XFQ0_LACSA|nr:hypothetical protein LSAT_V11C500253480 [Lactuca sativa]